MIDFDYTFTPKEINAIKGQFATFENCYNKRKNSLHITIKKRKKIEKLIRKLKGELESL